MPTIPEAIQTAMQHHQAGRLQEAEALYRQILQAQPDNADALHFLGLLAHHVGRHEVAVELIGKAIAITPSVAAFHNNIGEAYRAQRNGEEAANCYRRAITLKPDYADPYHNLGLVLQAQGREEEAMMYYRRALALMPANAEAHNNLANALKAQGNREEAEAHYRLAVAHKPDYAEAHNNLGTTLHDQGKSEEAVLHYRQAVALMPGFAEAHYNLGNVLQGQGKVEEAVDCYRQAVLFKPDYVEAENQLMHYLQHLCEWSRFDELVERHRDRIRKSPDATIVPFTMLCVPSSPAEQLECARNWVANRLAGAPALRGWPGFCHEKASKPRLRLGYLTADCRQHAMAPMLAALFELHERTSFEVVAYSYGRDDGGSMRKRIVAACDRFVDIVADSFVDAARRILEDGIDILIDLQGYTGPARPQIAALRPAPIQVNYLGYPGTMGADFIDYIVTDRFISPPGYEPFFTEKLVRLPECYQVNDRKREISERTPPRQEAGLSDGGFVFCCFNNTYKITPVVFDVWMRLLREIPGSVLWLLEANRGVTSNLRREASARGVDPGRLVFALRVSQGEHLARYRLADLFLDTLPYNAHVTASEALWAGLPVLTCAGETFASRVAGSLLNAAGLPEMITYSLEDYEACALRLARNPPELGGARERLAKNRMAMPLFDGERFTRHLERAYCMMWENFVKGKAPGLIEVSNEGFQP
jgi:predicted O-linked N-acetylglucosamine transferase (SPINDLY family)